MKLLTPLQTKDLGDQQKLRSVLRTQELEKAENAARRSLANAEADFNTTLAKNREKWALEEEEHAKRVIEQKAELTALEAKKLNALIPFKILKDGTLERLGDAESYLKQLEAREESNDELADRLQDKLDETGAKEQDLIKWERELAIRQDGIEHQNASTATATKLLSDQMAEFMDYKATSQAELAKMDAILDARTAQMVLREDVITAKEWELTDLAIRLADERQVLDRAFEEVRRLKTK